MLHGAGKEADPCGGAPQYARHRPERTLLYALIQEYYPIFEAHCAEQGKALPDYVCQEFTEYLKCSRLEHGFLRVRCDSCSPAESSPLPQSRVPPQVVLFDRN